MCVFTRAPLHVHSYMYAPTHVLLHVRPYTCVTCVLLHVWYICTLTCTPLHMHLYVCSYTGAITHVLLYSVCYMCTFTCALLHGSYIEAQCYNSELNRRPNTLLEINPK